MGCLTQLSALSLLVPSPIVNIGDVQHLLTYGCRVEMIGSAGAVECFIQSPMEHCAAAVVSELQCGLTGVTLQVAFIDTKRKGKSCSAALWLTLTQIQLSLFEVSFQ